MERKNVKIHPTVEVSDFAEIGEGTRIWHQAQIRENAKIGKNCIIGKNVYVDFGVVVGDNCKIQNNSSLYRGLTLESGVFVGPHVVFTNDLYPRAVNQYGSLKAATDWEIGKTVVEKGAALGAGSIVIVGRRIGAWALVGAGSVVTKDVPSHGLVVGNPARLIGFVCFCGKKLSFEKEEGENALMRCSACNATAKVPKELVRK